MPDTLQERLTAVPLTVGRRLTGLFWEMAPPVLFFFIALMLIFAVVKLLALQYSIRFYAFARAAIGALILGKVVLLMEMAEQKRKASRYPRAIVVAFEFKENHCHGPRHSRIRSRRAVYESDGDASWRSALRHRRCRDGSCVSQYACQRRDVRVNQRGRVYAFLRFFAR
jgi:hypothetical protein